MLHANIACTPCQLIGAITIIPCGMDHELAHDRRILCKQGRFYVLPSDAPLWSEDDQLNNSKHPIGLIVSKFACHELKGTQTLVERICFSTSVRLQFSYHTRTLCTI
jgi:hypothetical protein